MSLIFYQKIFIIIDKIKNWGQVHQIIKSHFVIMVNKEKFKHILVYSYYKKKIFYR